MSTAPVLEFICLFTHDLRRKQKRWQDGRLKYHTYNKRVMVHDERGNYVGDSHWNEDYDLGDGDEIQLERGSAIVQVAECTGSRDQDLTELVDKRLQDKAERQAAVIAKSVAATPNSSGSYAQVRQRPLQHAIITPTGHHGRAQIPTESPFQARQRMMATSPETPEGTQPAKRRKRETSPPSKSGYAQNLFGATLTLSGRPMSSAPLRRPQPSFPSRSMPTPQPPPSSTTAPEEEEKGSSPPNSPGLPPRGVTGPSPNALAVRQSLLKHAPRGMSSRQEVKLDMDAILITSSPDEPNLTPEADESRKPKKPNAKANKPLQPLSSNASLPTTKQKTAASTIGRSQSKVLPEEDNRKPQASRKKASKDKSVASGVEEARTTETGKSVDNKETRAKKSAPVPEKHTLPPRSCPVDEPRTELRIKPRKKRGLLMMSESQPKPTKSRKLERQRSASTAGRNKEPTQNEPILVDHKNGDPFEQPDLEKKNPTKQSQPKTRPERKHSRKEPRDQIHAATNLWEPSDDEFEEMPPAVKQDKTRMEAGEIFDDEDNEYTTTNRSLRTRLRKKEETNVVIQLDEEELLEPEPPKGPRIEKLARKSVRSREIFGFDFEDDFDFATGRKLNNSSVSAAIETTRSDASSASAPPAPPNEEVLPEVKLMTDCIMTEQKKEGSSLEFSSMPDISPPLSPQPMAQPDASNSAVLEEAGAVDCIPESQEPRAHLEAQEKGKAAVLPEKAGRAITLPMVKQHVETRPQRRTNSAPMGLKSMPEGQDDIEDSGSVSKPMVQQTRRLVNPATRGKKAAKPSDAAGQMPQCPLPPAEPAMPPQITLSRVVKEQMARQSERRDTSSTKSGGAPAQLPGFAKANGGPWSREAYDLFG